MDKAKGQGASWPWIHGEAIGANEKIASLFEPHALNSGECFAYACARFAGAPLHYKGDDFPQTDIESA